MGLLPFTAPFALIPIIPNIPGFYVSYRVWSNWKAEKGARILDNLVEQNKLECIKDPILDSLYPQSTLLITGDGKKEAEDTGNTAGSDTGSEGSDIILLEQEGIERIRDHYDAIALSVLIERAILQIKNKSRKSNT